MLFREDDGRDSGHAATDSSPLSVSSDCGSLGGPLASLNTSRGANLIPVSKLNEEMSCLDDTAQGSFGVVKRGKLDVDGHWYAVKQTKKVISGECDLQQRLQEIYALSACDHPHIVRYFDGWVEDKAAFMRTELFRHGSAGDLNHPVQEYLVRAVLHQIGSALHQLHVHGIIHRDVKPENILARQAGDDAQGRPQYIFKLCDFGLARPAHGSTSPQTGELFKGINDDDGDRNYLCPEAFTACDALHVGFQADVYALGASCVELMGGDPGEVRAGRYTYRTGTYSSEMQSLVRRMTARDPATRPDAFAVVMETLDSSLRACESVVSRLLRIQELHARIQQASLNDTATT